MLLLLPGAQALGDYPRHRHLLQEVLEESGYEVQLLWVNTVEAAGLGTLLAARLPQILPALLLIEVGGEPEPLVLALARQLKALPAFRLIPLVLVGGAGGPAQMDAALAAGAVAYLPRPVRPRELLACLTELIQAPPARTRQALDAFGHASLVVQETSGRCVCHTSLARELMQQYFSGGHFERASLPPELMLCLHREALRRRAGADSKNLTVLPQAQVGAVPKAPAVLAQRPRRLSFTLHAMDADSVGEGCCLIVLRESDDATP